jgi:hypothetical protein
MVVRFAVNINGGAKKSRRGRECKIFAQGVHGRVEVCREIFSFGPLRDGGSEDGSILDFVFRNNREVEWWYRAFWFNFLVEARSM